MSSHTNVSIPPRIPGFDTRITIDRNPTLKQSEVFINAIELVVLLSSWQWEKIIDFPFRMAGPEYTTEAAISPWPKGRTGLKAKHVVVAVHGAGFALALIPYEPADKVPALYAGLFLDNQQLGFMKWQSKRLEVPSDTVSHANTTRSSKRDTAVAEKTSLRARSGRMHDPNDPRWVIEYKVYDRAIDIADIFTACLDGIVAAAPNEAMENGAIINGVSHAGNIHVHLHGIGRPSSLSWQRAIFSVGAVFQQIIKEHANREWYFEVLFEMRKVGEGYLVDSTIPPLSNVVSSR